MVAESRRRLATNTIVTTVLVSLLTAKSQFSRLRLHHFISASKNRCSRISVFCRAPLFDAIDSEKYLVMRHVKLARVAATMLRRPEERKARVELTTLHVTAINRAFPTRLGIGSTIAATNSTLYVAHHHATEFRKFLLNELASSYRLFQVCANR